MSDQLPAAALAALSRRWWWLGLDGPHATPLLTGETVDPAGPCAVASAHPTRTGMLRVAAQTIANQPAGTRRLLRHAIRVALTASPEPGGLVIVETVNGIACAALIAHTDFPSRPRIIRAGPGWSGHDPLPGTGASRAH